MYFTANFFSLLVKHEIGNKALSHASLLFQGRVTDLMGGSGERSSSVNGERRSSVNGEGQVKISNL